MTEIGGEEFVQVATFARGYTVLGRRVNNSRKRIQRIKRKRKKILYRVFKNAKDAIAVLSILVVHHHQGGTRAVLVRVRACVCFSVIKRVPVARHGPLRKQ